MGVGVYGEGVERVVVVPAQRGDVVEFVAAAVKEVATTIVTLIHQLPQFLFDTS